MNKQLWTYGSLTFIPNAQLDKLERFPLKDFSQNEEISDAPT